MKKTLKYIPLQYSYHTILKIVLTYCTITKNRYGITSQKIFFSGFWLRQSAYLEQPDIHFEHSMIAEMETNEGKTIAWSTFQGYNRFLVEADAYRVPMLKERCHH